MSVEMKPVKNKLTKVLVALQLSFDASVHPSIHLSIHNYPHQKQIFIFRDATCVCFLFLKNQFFSFICTLFVLGTHLKKCYSGPWSYLCPQCLEQNQH